MKQLQEENHGCAIPTPPCDPQTRLVTAWLSESTSRGRGDWAPNPNLRSNRCGVKTTPKQAERAPKTKIAVGHRCPLFPDWSNLFHRFLTGHTHLLWALHGTEPALARTPRCRSSWRCRPGVGSPECSPVGRDQAVHQWGGEEKQAAVWKGGVLRSEWHPFLRWSPPKTVEIRLSSHLTCRPEKHEKETVNMSTQHTQCHDARPVVQHAEAAADPGPAAGHGTHIGLRGYFWGLKSGHSAGSPVEKWQPSREAAC